MKRIVITLIMVSMVFGLFLTGCSKDAGNTEKKTSAEVTEEETETVMAQQNVSDAKDGTGTEVDAETVKEVFEELEVLYPEWDIDIEVVKQIINDIDVDMDIILGEQTVEEAEGNLGNLLKYDVSSIDYEGYENEVYNLSYFTESPLEDIAVYFHMLFSDTPNYKGGMYDPEMGIGAAVRGEIFGLTTVIQMDVDDDGDVYVSIFCRQD